MSHGTRVCFILLLPLATYAFVKVGSFTPASYHLPRGDVDVHSSSNSLFLSSQLPSTSQLLRKSTVPVLSTERADSDGQMCIPDEISRRDVFKLALIMPLLSELAFSAPKRADAKLFGMEEDMVRIFEATVPSVCFISTEYTSIAEANKIDLNSLPKGVGSGFVWDKQGHIVTNFHVINKVDNAIVTLTDSKGNSEKYKAKLTGVDPDKDIAVLKIDVSPDQLQPISVGQSDNLRVGQFALAIGNPFGQDHTLTTGVVSGKNRMITAPTGRKINGVIQTDAAINPGNSGGPLLDSSGNLIGINTATLGAGVNAGVSFAIPIDTAKGVIEQLITYGQAQRAVLGISYLERLPSPAESERSGIPRIEKGVVVLEVPPNSPCAKAGMQGVIRSKEPGSKPVVGDVIVGINSYSINGSVDMTSVIEKFKPGDTVTVHVMRGPDLKPMDLTVTLGAFKGSAFSKIESERPLPPGEIAPNFNIPLGDIAPQITPQLPPN